MIDNPELLGNIGYIIGGAIIPVAGYCIPIIKDWITRRKERGARKTLKKEYVVKDYAIIQQLTELLIHCDADRSYVFQYHNGENFSPSYKNAIWKISCSHEVSKTGIKRSYTDFLAVFVSHAIEYIAPLMVGDSGEHVEGVHHLAINTKRCPKRIVVIFEVEKMANCFMKQKFIDGGAKFVVAMNMLNDNDPIGTVAVEFCDPNLTLEKIMFRLGTDDELVNYSERLEYTICY